MDRQSGGSSEGNAPMADLPVHWREGMFLRPQHFQAMQRHLAARADVGDKWNTHYCWGIRSIQFSRDALSNYRFEVASLRVRFRDGTLLTVPEDCSLPSLDLKPALEGAKACMVSIGIPSYNPSQGNVSAERGDVVRYLAESRSREDENTGQNAQTIELRRPNARLLIDGDNLSSYDVIPVARVRRADEAVAVPELDPDFFPPVLACDAWQPLGTDLLRAICHRIGRKVELLASQVTSRRISFESQNQSDSLVFAQLRELNEAYSLLKILTSAEGIHPLHAYLELARLVGQLAIFTKETRRPPDLPNYDHDDLARCFSEAKRHIDDLLGRVVEPEFKELPFFGFEARMQVLRLEPRWLEPGWEMYIGVQTSLARDECVRMLTHPGALDIKVGSVERVDEIFVGGGRGLRFSHELHPPSDLPVQRPGLLFFRIKRDSDPEEWRHVVESRSLAIRLNDDLIAGNMQDKSSLSVRLATGQTTSMHFVLFVVPHESPEATDPAR